MNSRKTLFIINPNANMGQAWMEAAERLESPAGG